MIAVMADGIVISRHEFLTKSKTDETHQLLFALVGIAWKSQNSEDEKKHPEVWEMDNWKFSGSRKNSGFPMFGIYTNLNFNMDTQNYEELVETVKQVESNIAWC